MCTYYAFVHDFRHYHAASTLQMTIRKHGYQWGREGYLLSFQKGEKHKNEQ